MAAGVQYNHIPQTIEKMQKAASQLVRKGAFAIERKAKQLAPVDTGLLKNSIYTVTGDTSGAVAASAGWLRNRKHSFSQHEQLTFPEQGATGNPLRALVLVGATYGAYVHYGTGHMRARPFLYAAYNQERPAFLEAWRKLEERLR